MGQWKSCLCNVQYNADSLACLYGGQEQPQWATISKSEECFFLGLVALFKHRINSSTNKNAGTLKYKDIQSTLGAVAISIQCMPWEKNSNTHTRFCLCFIFIIQECLKPE